MTLVWVYDDGTPVHAVLSARQRTEVRILARRLRLSDRALDQHCMAVYGEPLARLRPRQGDALIAALRARTVRVAPSQMEMFV